MKEGKEMKKENEVAVNVKEVPAVVVEKASIKQLIANRRHEKAVRKALKAELELKVLDDPEDQDSRNQLKNLRKEELISTSKKATIVAVAVSGVVAGVVQILASAGKNDVVDIDYEETETGDEPDSED